jgi:F-type H+-transporting ATPase subunit gamma
MATLKELRKRLQSVKNTQQITKAMKMVAAAKLRHAQESLVATRPYAKGVHEMIAHVAARTESMSHPLLERRERKRAQVICLTSDRGLCGGFNSNVIKKTHNYLEGKGLDHSDAVARDEHEHMELALIGRKGIEFFKRRDYDVRQNYLDVLTDPSFETVSNIGSNVIADYIDGNLDAVFLVYNEFKSAIAQHVVIEQILPVVPTLTDVTSKVDFKYEPDKTAILDTLLPAYVNVEIYRAVLESLASEMGARMTAMDNATRNASDLIDRLSLQYNRARQAAITTELMEITSGSEALKKA